MAGKLIRRGIYVLLFILIMDIGISIWVITRDLEQRYPGTDLRRGKLGVASWYSEKDKNINDKTANGEKFDDSKLTCASWNHPFNTRLIVVNLINGRWVECRVNDRGPNKRLNREIDLTRAAFKKIASLRRGLIYVTVIPITEKIPAK